MGVSQAQDKSTQYEVFVEVMVCYGSFIGKRGSALGVLY